MVPGFMLIYQLMRFYHFSLPLGSFRLLELLVSYFFGLAQIIRATCKLPMKRPVERDDWHNLMFVD
jgi:hypothetical protein